jgi:hypothetical protein
MNIALDGDFGWRLRKWGVLTLAPALAITIV